MQDHEALSRLAKVIDEGASIDWRSTESNVPDEPTKEVIREMAVIAALSNVHRSAGVPLTDSAPQASRTWGSFHLLEKVGDGAYGEVYRAWDARLDREVALKLLPENAVDQNSTSVVQEGRLLAKVRHPNVVTIYGAEHAENRIGLWMEFIRGRTLEQLLDAGVMGERDVIAVGRELCSAVSAVHGAGLLHRDIKAQNVMRSDEGRVVLMDFGAGRTVDEATGVDLAGTPLYLAPEVLQGQSATVRSDVYSLGVLLYHLLTREYPVNARTVREIRRAHERNDRAGVREHRVDVSPKLTRVIERAIDPDPAKRYRTVDELAAELTALTSRSTVMRLVIGASAGAAVVLAAALGWQMAMGSDPRTAASVIERPVIAVLPFENLGAEPDAEYFADGLTGEIMRDLATVPGLQVLSRTSSFAFKAQPRNLQDIRDRLGANLVVEGAVRRAGSRMQITARLGQVGVAIPLWAEQFDRESKDVFLVRDEISRAIVNSLHLTLNRNPRLVQANPEAYDSYLRGRALVDRRGLANVRKAAEWFERAIAEDPAFAPAHAGLANAYAFMSFPFMGIDFETAYPIMRPAAAKAVQLDPMLAEAYSAMGWAYAYERDWANADAAFRKAISLNPSLTQAYTSYSVSTLQPLQRFDEALRLLAGASIRDPLSLDVLREIGEVQLFAGRYAEAVATFVRVSEVEPDFPFLQAYLGKALIFAGRVPEGLAHLELGSSSPWLASGYVKSGRRAEAEKLAADLQAHPYRLAVVAGALGDTQRTLDALDRAALHEPHRVGRLLIEPELMGVRDHPRVVAIRRSFNLP